MTFIITLIALLMERFFHWHHLRHWNWFTHYERWLSKYVKHWSPILSYLINLLPPLIIVIIITKLLSGLLGGILELIFSAFVLLYCLGPENLWVQVYRCIHALNKENPHAAIEQTQTAFGISPPEHSQAFHLKFISAIFSAALDRIFAVIFWFMLLGPVGAVFYRLNDSFCIHPSLGFSQMAKRAKKVLDWLPVRIFSFLFALGGHFSQVFAYWKKEAPKGVDANEALIIECGLAALSMEEMIPEDGTAEREALALLDRVLVIWLVILSIGVLIPY